MEYPEKKLLCAPEKKLPKRTAFVVVGVRASQWAVPGNEFLYHNYGCPHDATQPNDPM